jgi:hypothetical protein
VSSLQVVRANTRKRAALALVPLTTVVIFFSFNVLSDGSGPHCGAIRLGLASVAATSLAAMWIIWCFALKASKTQAGRLSL